jgi:hypothetical protein
MICCAPFASADWRCWFTATEVLGSGCGDLTVHAGGQRGFYLLREQTPYNLAFWGGGDPGDHYPGGDIPGVISSIKPANLVMGAFLAVCGLVLNRWDVTVSGLYVPLSYSPGTLYKLNPVNYSPALAEWGIAAGIIGYALMMLTLGVKFLPLFKVEEH